MAAARARKLIPRGLEKNTFGEKGKKTNSYSVAIGVDISVFCKPVLYILVLSVPRKNMDVQSGVNSF